MPQTLLTLFAIVLVSLLSLNQQRASTHARMQMIRTEVETHAETVAIEMMETLRSLPFDQAVVGGNAISSVNDFTTLSSSKIGYTSQQRTMNYDQVNDLGDLKYARTHSVSRQGKHGTIDYTIDFDVRYVRQKTGGNSVETTSDRTFTKEVVLEINHHLLNSPITLSRIYSYRQ